MISVQFYEEALSEKWDHFVENEARNSTFLHTRKFFRHNPVNQELDCSLIFLKNSNIICVMPAVLQKATGHTIWNSHAYSTYGGFIVSNKFGVEEALEVVDIAIQNARDKGANEIIVRNPFRIFNAIPTDETDYAMWQKGFRILRRDVEITIPLIGLTPQTVDSLYDGNTRKAIRKAEKGNVKVKLTSDFESYWQILEENLVQRHGVKPTHTLKQFQTLEQLVGAEKIKLFGAYLDDRLIAGIILFVVNERAVHAQYIASSQEFQHIRPINLLIHRICIWAIENHFKFFNLGMVNNPDGSGVNLGLCKFKEGFGARSILRETMHLVLK